MTAIARGLVAVAVAGWLAMVPTVEAQAQDRHAGYYYPPQTTSEFYCARAPVLPDSDSDRRLGFVIGLTQEAVKRPYPPEVALFTKGIDQEKLIMVAIHEGTISTLYQARGYLAQFTALARTSDIFVQNGVEDYYTFYDLLRLMGFERLTISDGETYAHQIDIVSPESPGCIGDASLPVDRN